MIVLVIILGGAFAAGLLLRSWAVVLLPAVLWPLYYLGLGEGWWGDGLGEAWQYPAVLLTTGTMAAAAAGVGAGRSHRRTDA